MSWMSLIHLGYILTSRICQEEYPTYIHQVLEYPRIGYVSYTTTFPSLQVSMLYRCQQLMSSKLNHSVSCYSDQEGCKYVKSTDNCSFINFNIFLTLTFW